MSRVHCPASRDRAGAPGPVCKPEASVQRHLLSVCGNVMRVQCNLQLLTGLLIIWTF